MTSRRRGGEAGASLVLALAFLSLLGMFVAAVLSFASVSFDNTVVTRTRSKQLYAADGGIEYGIRSAQMDTSKCATTGSTFTWPTQTINGRTVTVSCNWISGGGTTGGTPLLGRYAAILTGSPSITTGGPANGLTLNLNGDVYAAGSITPGQSTVAVNGNLEVQGASCPYTTATNPKVTGTCTPLTAQPPVSQPPLAPTVTVPTKIAPAPAAATTPNCTILYPGKYGQDAREVPSFQPGQRYYLATGTYYFNNREPNLQGEIYGGAIPAGELRQLSGNGPCATDAQARSRPGHTSSDVGAGTGVTIILGGTSKLRVQAVSTTRIELFTRTGAESGTTNGVTIWGRDAAQANYNRLTQSPALESEPKDANVVFHGLAYTPNAVLRSRGMANTGANGASLFSGGVVARQLHFEFDNSAGVVQAVGNATATFSARTMRITSNAAGTGGSASTQVRAVVLPDALPPTIESWRQG